MVMGWLDGNGMVMSCFRWLWGGLGGYGVAHMAAQEFVAFPGCPICPVCAPWHIPCPRGAALVPGSFQGDNSTKPRFIS